MNTLRQRIRSIAICVIRQDEKIFVTDGYDSVKGTSYHRPLGGGMEFGEHSRETVLREFREELGAELENVRYLCTLENVFTLEGRTGHEIVQVYEADFIDESWYRVESARVQVGPELALWKPLGAFAGEEARLVPEGLLEILI